MPPPSLQHFTPDEWNRHLTYRRFFPEPRVLAVIVISMSPLWLWSVAVAAVVGLYAELAEPRGAPAISNHPSFIAPFTLTSFALSLLMLFKTNSRWVGVERPCGHATVCEGLYRPAAGCAAAMPQLSRTSAAPCPLCRSYGRWWEARQAMGALLVHSRCLVRLVGVTQWGR